METQISKSAKIAILCLAIVLVAFPIMSASGVESEWSSAITIKTYRWYALKSELRDLHTEEKYRHYGLIGGINIPGGDTKVSLRSQPPNNFDFFNGSRLDMRGTIEGDMGIGFDHHGSDYHLLLLPIKSNGVSFFELLFNEKFLLENLTHSAYLNSTITETKAVADLKFNETLDVKYEWDITTGILSRKVVTAPSGKQLIVVPGTSPFSLIIRGHFTPFLPWLIFLFSNVIILCLFSFIFTGKTVSMAIVEKSQIRSAIALVYGVLSLIVLSGMWIMFGGLIAAGAIFESVSYAMFLPILLSCFTVGMISGNLKKGALLAIMIGLIGILPVYVIAMLIELVLGVLTQQTIQNFLGFILQPTQWSAPFIIVLSPLFGIGGAWLSREKFYSSSTETQGEEEQWNPEIQGRL